MVECLYSVPYWIVIYVGYVDIGTRNNCRYYPRTHREDLIGSGPKCLIRAIPPRTDKPSAPPPKLPPRGKQPLPKGRIPKPTAPKGAVTKAANKGGKRK